MATTYVVLLEAVSEDDQPQTFGVLSVTVEAANAEKACRIVADKMTDEALAEGVTLIAVPTRNWTTGRNTFKAETRRRLLKT